MADLDAALSRAVDLLGKSDRSAHDVRDSAASLLAAVLRARDGARAGDAPTAALLATRLACSTC